MKFSTIIAPFLAAFAVAAPAAAAPSQEVTVQSVLENLTSTVKQHTGAMNSTLASMPQDASPEQRSAVVASVNAQLRDITVAMHNANVQIGTVDKRAQPTLEDLPHAVLGQLNGQPLDLAKLLLPLLQELNPAVRSVLRTLYLGEVDAALQPLLTTELPALVIGLNKLVHGLLVALAPLLTGLGSLLAPLLAGLGL